MKMTPARLARQRAEYDLIVQTLKKTNFNKKAAADLLGVSGKTIYNKLKRYRHFAETGQTESIS
jgi:two-component system response regulator HydG